MSMNKEKDEYLKYSNNPFRYPSFKKYEKFARTFKRRQTR